MVGSKVWHGTAVKALVVFVVAVIAIGARRWPQLISPDVWVEDGLTVVPSYVHDGWAGLFDPVNGYLIVPSKLTTFVALTLSFDHYALVSTILAIAAQAAVVVVVAVAPTVLAAPVLAALLALFLPIGSEVYGLPLFVFWWTTLLLILALFWRDGTSLGWRVAAIVVGGLSSPFVVAAWPAFAVRAVVDRNRGNLVALVAALALATVQGSIMMRLHATGAEPPFEALHHIPSLISKYFGTALYSLGQHGAGPFGAAVVIFLAGAVLAIPRERRLVYVLLALCLAVAIFTSVARVPVDAPHPLLAGPRYFFFPLLLTGWMLIMLAQEARRSVALIAMIIAGAYAPSLAASFLYQPQEPREPWPDQVAACVAAPDTYTFDIQLGIPNRSWALTLRGDDCRKLEATAWFDRHSPEDGRPPPVDVR